MGEPELEEPGMEPEPELEPEPEEPPQEPDPFEERWAKEGWEPREHVAAPEPAPGPPPERAPDPERVALPAAPVEETPPEIPLPAAAPPPRSWLRTAAVLLLLLTAGIVAVSIRFRRAEASPPAAVVLPQPAPARVEPAPPVPVLEPKKPPAPNTRASNARLSVPEFGIGERDRFQAGQRVTFTTRVLGGRSGDRIRHVWMRDGKVEQAISLPVGASSWRTHSTKTVGRPGSWEVEARDAEGQVLARASFDVVTR